MSETELYEQEAIADEAQAPEDMEAGAVDESGQEAEVPPSLDWESKARDTGWKPPSEWKGTLPENYIDDPKVWVATRSFADQLARERREAEALRNDVEEIRRFTDAQRRAHAEELERARLEAVELGDTEAFKRADKRLQDLSQEKETRQAPPSDDPTQPGGPQDPAFLAWKEDNAWFEQDPARTKYAASVGQREARQQGLTPEHGRPYYDTIANVVTRDLGEAPNTTKQAVSRGGEGQGEAQAGARKKTLWSRLPAEVRDQMNKSAALRRGVVTNDNAGREQLARIWLSENGEKI